MTACPLKTKLAQGQPVLGVWNIISAPMVVEIFAKAGFDFGILDMEHGPFDLSSLEAAIRGCEVGGAAPLVRVPGVFPHMVQSVLDLGAHGVVFPQIRNAADGRTATASARLPPLGVRGFNPFTRAGDYGGRPGGPDSRFAPDFPLNCLIVENSEAVADLDAILAIDAVDVIYLGVYDMSVALGHPGDVTAPAVVCFVKETARRTLAAGKSVGMMVKTSDEMAYALDLGASFLVHGVDSLTIHQAARAAVSALDRLAGR